MFDYTKTPYKRLEKLVKDSDREVNQDWVRDELYAIDYLNLAEEFLDKAETHTYTNVGNSSVLYAIGATDDPPESYPTHLTVYKGRVSPPDIDLDVDDRKRELAIERARTVYGADHVAHIGTFGTVRAKNALRDAARALGYESSKADEVASLVPDPVMGIYKGLDESLQSKKHREAYQNDPDIKKITDAALGLEGLVRQWGVHAAGVVVSQGRTIDTIPVMTRGLDDPPVTQWDMHRVEEFGQLKIDFLGLRNLGVIDMCIENIKELRGEEIDLDAIPLDDELTYEQLRKGRGIGCFQIEGSQMREMMVNLQPDAIEDLMALVALYRPGPLGSGMDKQYISRKHGRNSDSKLPILDELLPRSNGILLYQEDVLKVAREIAGFSATEADALRKIVGKKLVDKMPEMRQDFVDGCVEVGRISRDEAEELFADIAHHASYSFNAAHAISYALVSYQTAYFKFNYPAEYMAALLTATPTTDSAAIYLAECRRMGLTVLPPSINESDDKFKVVDEKTILFGLESIDGIGPAIIDMINRSRKGDPFYSMYDFMRRCDREVLNKTTLEHLMGSGALDELIPEQPKSDLSREEKKFMIERERKELGLFVTEHPLDSVWHFIEPSTTHTTEFIQDCSDNQRIVVGGIITGVKEITTRRGQLMYAGTIEDISGSAPFVVFPGVAGKVTPINGDIVLMAGKAISDNFYDNRLVKIATMEITTPDIPESGGSERPIIIHCNNRPSYDTLEEVYKYIKHNPGESAVFINIKEDGNTITLKSSMNTSSESQKEVERMLNG